MVKTDITGEKSTFMAYSDCHDLMVMVYDGDIYEAMNITEDVMLHYENGDYPGRMCGEVLETELEDKGIDVAVYERV